MSNPLMQNSPNQGAWLGGNAQQSPIVSQDLKKLYAMYQMSNDPKSFMHQVMSANPTLEAMSHGNMKEQFYAECQRRGVNPEAFLAQVKQGLNSK